VLYFRIEGIILAPEILSRIIELDDFVAVASRIAKATTATEVPAPKRRLSAASRDTQAVSNDDAGSISPHLGTGQDTRSTQLSSG